MLTIGETIHTILMSVHCLPFNQTPSPSQAIASRQSLILTLLMSSKDENNNIIIIIIIGPALAHGWPQTSLFSEIESTDGNSITEC